MFSHWNHPNWRLWKSKLEHIVSNDFKTDQDDQKPSITSPSYWDYETVTQNPLRRWLVRVQTVNIPEETRGTEENEWSSNMWTVCPSLFPVSYLATTHGQWSVRHSNACTAVCVYVWEIKHKIKLCKFFKSNGFITFHNSRRVIWENRNIWAVNLTITAWCA